MPISLRDWSGRVKEAEASADDLRRRLAEQEAKEAAVKAAAEQAAKDEAARVKQARRELQARLVTLREEYGQPLPEAERPGPVTRKNARTFLHPDESESPAALLGVLATADPLVGLWHHRSQVAGRLMVQADQAGIGGELIDQIDDLECEAWRSAMVRIQQLAGEVAP
jgi:hypothetical protein